MHDINSIRENPDEFDKELARRDLKPYAAEILALDKKVREHKGDLQELQQRRNVVAKAIGKVKGQGGNASDLLQEAEEIKNKIMTLEDGGQQQQQLTKLLASIPNILAADVPAGKSADDNQELRKIGKPRKFSFKAKDHDVLGENLGMMDFKQAALISGSRFVTLSAGLARLERAIANFCLDVLTKEHGFVETAPPLLVRDNALFGTGQLPKFAEDNFQTTDDRWLIPTAEVSLANMMQERLVEFDDLPICLTAYTPCFRQEAGAAGKDTKGMIRMHQFNKVEMVVICADDKSQEQHKRMLSIAESLLTKLDLPFRTTLLCSGDTGFSVNKTYDIEVWLPGQERYREISSCSNCDGFQARRMNGRYKQNKSNKFVHTLNGSALPVGRTLIAIMENYQNEDGSITVPDILRPYMDGLEKISK
jgi:seryl-tRNA synthetase